MNNELLFPSRQKYTCIVKYPLFMALKFCFNRCKILIISPRKFCDYRFSQFQITSRKTNTKWPSTIQSGPSHFVISGNQNSGPFKWSNCPPARPVTCPATPAPTLAVANIWTTIHVWAERASGQWGVSDISQPTFTGRQILLVIDKYSFLAPTS